MARQGQASRPTHFLRNLFLPAHRRACGPPPPVAQVAAFPSSEHDDDAPLECRDPSGRVCRDGRAYRHLTTSAPERARALQPLLDAHGAEMDRRRELTPEVVEALVADMLRLLLPKSLGGQEIHLLEYAKTTEALAWADASVGWFVNQSNVSSATSAAAMPHEAAAAVFGDPRDGLAWGARHSGARRSGSTAAIASPAPGASPAAAVTPNGSAPTAPCRIPTARRTSATAGRTTAASCSCARRPRSSTTGTCSACAAPAATPTRSRTCSCPTSTRRRATRCRSGARTGRSTPSWARRCSTPPASAA